MQIVHPKMNVAKLGDDLAGGRVILIFHLAAAGRLGWWVVGWLSFGQLNDEGGGGGAAAVAAAAAVGDCEWGQDTGVEFEPVSRRARWHIARSARSPPLSPPHR